MEKEQDNFFLKKFNENYQFVKKFTENIEEYTYLLKNNLKNYKMELAKEIFNL